MLPLEGIRVVIFEHAIAAPFCTRQLADLGARVIKIERPGVDYASLGERYPGLIVCDISGYGLDGPYRDRKAYDLLIQSEAGFLSVT
ncbi:CoA transferase, partial [Burkholderia vietnamiensis]|uniref:CoA transferase n=1 Tax=Burkholderia vietnamiensis TaxID=60552 RepID=UPI001592BED2